MFQTVLLVIQIFVSLALVGIILLQRSEGSGLISSSTGSPSSFMSARGAANLLTRATATLAALFIGLNLALAILAGNHGQGTSLLDQLPAGPAAPDPATPNPAKTAPAAPQVPMPQPATAPAGKSAPAAPAPATASAARTVSAKPGSAKPAGTAPAAPDVPITK